MELQKHNPKELDTNISSIRLDPMAEFITKRSRDGEMMLFDDYRLSLGGADNDWGTHVFYNTMLSIGFLEKAVVISNGKKKSKKATYAPTTPAKDKFPQLFFYDIENKIYGLNYKNIETFDDEILPSLSTRAVIVRAKYKQEKERRNKANAVARRAEKNMNSVKVESLFD